MWSQRPLLHGVSSGVATSSSNFSASSTAAGLLSPYQRCSAQVASSAGTAAPAATAIGRRKRRCNSLCAPRSVALAAASMESGSGTLAEVLDPHRLVDGYSGPALRQGLVDGNQPNLIEWDTVEPPMVHALGRGPLSSAKVLAPAGALSSEGNGQVASSLGRLDGNGSTARLHVGSDAPAEPIIEQELRPLPADGEVQPEASTSAHQTEAADQGAGRRSVLLGRRSVQVHGPVASGAQGPPTAARQGQGQELGDEPQQHEHEQQQDKHLQLRSQGRGAYWSQQLPGTDAVHQQPLELAQAQQPPSPGLGTQQPRPSQPRTHRQLQPPTVSSRSLQFPPARLEAGAVQAPVRYDRPRLRPPPQPTTWANFPYARHPTASPCKADDAAALQLEAVFQCVLRSPRVPPKLLRFLKRLTPPPSSAPAAATPPPHVPTSSFPASRGRPSSGSSSSGGHSSTTSDGVAVHLPAIRATVERLSAVCGRELALYLIRRKPWVVMVPAEQVGVAFENLRLLLRLPGPAAVLELLRKNPGLLRMERATLRERYQALHATTPFSSEQVGRREGSRACVVWVDGRCGRERGAERGSHQGAPACGAG